MEPLIPRAIKPSATSGDVLTTVDGVAGWAAPPPGLPEPLGADGTVLTVVAGEPGWAEPPVGTGGGDLDDLGDVDTTTTAPAVGQALVWDGSQWVPGTVAGGGGPVDAYTKSEVGILPADFVAVFEGALTA